MANSGGLPVPPKKTNDVGDFMTDASDTLPLAGTDYSMPLSGGIVEKAITGFESEGEKALNVRYGKPSRWKEVLAYEFTRDPALLHQYRELYESECRVVSLPSFYAAENDYNQKSHILVVRQGKLCVGGGRLSVRTPRQPNSLPLEINGFRLRDYFPELEQKQMRYGELSRLVILPDFRTGDVTREIFRNMYRKSLALDLDMVYAAAPLVNVRSYKNQCLAVGLKEPRVHLDIEVPPYPGHEEVKDYLFSVVVEKSAAARKTILQEDSATPIAEEA
jgi:hypothetical protein